MTQGYMSYVSVIGKKFDAFDELPYQIDPRNSTDPQELETNEFLDPAFMKCATEHREISVSDILDALYLDDGKYVFDRVSCAGKSQFLAEVSNLHIYY